MIKASPFHRRAADANRENAWSTRDGVTLSLFYSAAEAEALAARSAAILCDISWRTRLRISGAEAESFLARLATQNVARLAIGQAMQALWLGDDGSRQGRGAIGRLSRESFLLETGDPAEWIEQAATRFHVSLQREDAGLALIGPMAGAILAAAGLSAPEYMSVRGTVWREIDLTLSRLGSGVEIWCRAGDAELVWDVIAAAGEAFGLIPGGLAAQDILELETALPEALLVDVEHDFNGRRAYLKAQAESGRTIIGIDIDSDVPAPYAQLLHRGWPVGRILSSCYSPALGRAIALAEVEKALAETGSEFTLVLPPDRGNSEPRTVEARGVTLPFLSL